MRLASLCLLAASARACNLTGTWVDRAGNIATLLVAPDGSIAARSFSGTRWASCAGRVIDATHAWLAFHPDDNETATVETNCSALVLTASAAPSVWGKVGDYLYGEGDVGRAAVVTDVHLVFMSHLDLGYTDLARNICDYYFNANLPGNAALAAALANTSTPYALTSHAFLVAEFLDAAAGCAHAPPPPAAAAAVEAAARAGWIRWHAGSANYNAALAGRRAFAAQLREADALNARFGQRWGEELFKSTDIPGLPRSVIPLLAAAGRRAVHTGANGKCQLGRVPQAFTWAHPESGTQVLALATNDYGGTLVVPPHALVIAYQGDNGGAPTAASVAATYAAAAARFPRAAVALSSFEAFTAAALAAVPGAAALPVVASELGDSWAYGGGADPSKLAAYREAERAAADALAGGALPAGDANLRAWTRRALVGGPEHNGGVSIGAYLPGSRGRAGGWDNAAFRENFPSAAYQFVQSSYDEKYNMSTQPLAPVSPSPAWSAFLADRAARVAALTPAAPDVSPASGWARVADPAAPRACGRLTLALDAADGSVASLVDAATGHEWAGARFLGLTYRTYAEADFDTFNAEYTPACGVPCANFAKPGMDAAAPASVEWRPALVAAYARAPPAPAACALLLELALPPEAVARYGGAGALWATLTVDADAASAAPVVELAYSVLNKTLTRLAEAAFVSFAPRVELAAGAAAARAARAAARPPAAPPAPAAWWLDVLGEPVDPLDVVVMGTRHLHAVEAGFGFGAGAPRGGAAAARARAPRAAPAVAAFRVETLDAALVAVGDRAHLLHYDGHNLPDLEGGMHVVLWNNLWGTTFAQWWARDQLFRFRVTLEV